MSELDPLDLGGRRIGPGEPCLVIAEAGVNHDGDPTLAEQLIDAAANAGAEAVKFQSFDPGRLVSPSAEKAPYQRRAGGSEEHQLQMLRRLELTAETHHRLAARCRERGILFLSSPFDRGSADLLESLGVVAFKVASGEITHHDLLAHLAAKGRPLIVSTGMCDLADVERALKVIVAAGDPPVMLLHCVSAYPADPADANLHAMETMARAFRVPVGFSDHTRGVEVALAAVALGARVVEKHLTLDRHLPGPDHAASLLPDELAAMVRGIRRVESALGDGRKRPVAAEHDIAAAARRSVVAGRDLPAGTVLATEDLQALRPGTGIEPRLAPRLVGRRLARAVSAGEPIEWEMLG